MSDQFRPAFEWEGLTVGWAYGAGGQIRLALRCAESDLAFAARLFGLKEVVSAGGLWLADFGPETDDTMMRLMDGLVRLRDCHPALVQLPLLLTPEQMAAEAADRA